jgi:hypothetical protein
VPGAAVLSRRIWVGAVRIVPPCCTDIAA